jgi:hypothetical protein
MEQGDHLHLIGVGNLEDWAAGRGSLYYMEDKNGEKCLRGQCLEPGRCSFDNLRPAGLGNIRESVGAHNRRAEHSLRRPDACSAHP